jgi:hypothetical protein
MHTTLAVALAFTAMSAEAQQSPAWKIEGSRAAPPYRLTLPDVSPGMAFIFDCSGDTLKVTETGVTELADMSAKTDRRVPDEGPNRVMPAGSAMMAIYTDGSLKPEFKPGSAVANPVKGWDLTIELGRKDKSFRAIGATKTLSLFTTGITVAVALERADRKLIGDFVKACGK